MTGQNENPERLDEILAAYTEAIEHGWATPDLTELQRCYPDLSEDLARFFANNGRVQRVLAPLRPPASTAGPEARTLGIDPCWPSVPGYEIVAEVGRGGMGVVYKARQVKANRVVALKMILAGKHASESERMRFLTEAQAAARLQDHGIVQMFEVGEHEGLPFFSMEFCGGGSLADLLDGTPWQPSDAARVVETLARATHAANEQHIIHRDLKPGNVLLVRDEGRRGRGAL